MRSRLTRLASEYGIVLALIVLGGAFSAATLAEQSDEGAAGGDELARRITRNHPGKSVVIVTGSGRDDVAFADALRIGLQLSGSDLVVAVRGSPAVARQTLTRLAAQGTPPDVIAVSRTASRWTLFDDLPAKVPGIGSPAIETARAYRWPNFLKADNLLNIANQIAVIAILAVGMTFVIITGGIDLSVGSLIALAAVVSTLLIRERFGAEGASPAGMVLAGLAAIAVCGAVGFLTGLIVTEFAVPSFIITLGVMLAARGAATKLSDAGSIFQVPDSFVWLGRGADLFGIPNAVVLMLVLYLVAHVVLTRTALGRYIYAVGGNAEAARLAGVRVGAVTIFVFTLSGLLAGLGGVVMASQLKSGAPTYGQTYELYVIAAVVVGGTSLSGGEGNVVGTLLGAFLIAVIQNGMNLTGLGSDTQAIVLGAIIVAAVLVDRLKHRR